MTLESWVSANAITEDSVEPVPFMSVQMLIFDQILDQSTPVKCYTRF